MAELEMYLDGKLLEGISELAVKHYGEDSESSRKRVVETALKMRIVWSNSIKMGQQETDEAVSQWEFPESTVKQEDSDGIQNWLFKR
jgi:hypothetical protein